MYQLFTDDTSLFLAVTKENFMETRAIIAVYERISGVRLNLEKSTIVPLEDDLCPDWFFWIGCKISQPREVLTFLGCPIGVKLMASKEAEFFMDKVSKWINH